ncbi:MAG TPA: VanZ family protein [Anaerolineales bacterium]|nr:VanZ family protein [Anaerolineales bacterium]
MKWLTILFALFLLLIIVLADTGRLGMLAIIYRIPSADKVGHFILYGILALLLNLTLFRSFPKQNKIWLAVVSGLILAVLIGLEELSQQSFVNRTFSLADLSASYLGVIFFAWLAVKTNSRKVNREVNLS